MVRDLAGGLQMTNAEPDDRLPELPAHAFDKEDEDDDLDFYGPSRLVTHIDAPAVEALSGFYRRLLPQGGRVLDLMSSWVSHLPDDGRYAEVVGHGMNAEELAANPRLTRWFVQDLNARTELPLEDGAFDAALCCVGVQYLQRPVAVFREVRRVLAPGAPFVVSFSNRCFPTKAVRVWLELDTRGHASLVHLYLDRAGFSDVSAELLRTGYDSDPLAALVGRA
jgi:SAM-dependent methyltransferase